MRIRLERVVAGPELTAGTGWEGDVSDALGRALCGASPPAAVRLDHPADPGPLAPRTAEAPLAPRTAEAPRPQRRRGKRQR